jgi:thiamine pyrophosphokinase
MGDDTTSTRDRRLALVITGGDRLDTSFLRRLPAQHRDFDIVIAADSGVDSALALGIIPDIVVGDLDSVSTEGLALVREWDREIIEMPTDKDVTDTEVALQVAVTRDMHEIVVLSPGGGRLDHAHGVITALFHPQLARCRVQAVIGKAHVHVLHGGDDVSVSRPRTPVLAMHAMNGIARGVTTRGLRWNLDNHDLEPWVSRGVSNEVVDEMAHVTLGDGALMVMLPLAHSETNNNREGSPS